MDIDNLFFISRIRLDPNPWAWTFFGDNWCGQADLGW